MYAQTQAIEGACNRGSICPLGNLHECLKYPDLDGSNPRGSLFRATRSQTALLAKTSHSPRAGSRPFPRVAGIPYAEVYPRGLEA
jgi:hypothetical protein